MVLNAIQWAVVGKVLLTILIILLILLVILYFMGRKMQKRQEEQAPIIEANTMDATILVIDKKKMSIKDAVAAGLPKQVQEQTPVYLKLQKLPIVKAKVGNRLVTMIADPAVFDLIPVKREVKVTVSGLYIRSVKSARGGLEQVAPKKKGFLQKTTAKAAEIVKKDSEERAKQNKDKKKK